MMKGNGTGKAMTTLLAVMAIVALWTAAASIEITVPLWGKAIATLGNICPLPTAYVLEIARVHIAWWIAATGTLLIGSLWVASSRVCVATCAAALFISAIGASLSALALALPLYKYAPVIAAV